jgi:hypothetical protein
MKSAASLTASLLARKGQANPTDGMQPAGMSSPAAAPLGHNDRRQNSEHMIPKRPVGSGKRIAMTVRLDHEQHLRLRVFSAHKQRSSQEILALALDRYIDEHAPASLDTACLSLKS